MLCSRASRLCSHRTVSSFQGMGGSAHSLSGSHLGMGLPARVLRTRSFQRSKCWCRSLMVCAPGTGAHIIGELLQHLLLWNERVRNTLAGSPMPKWEPEREWAEPPIPWKELTVRWEQSRDALEQSIRKFPYEDAPRTVPGRNYSHEVLLEGIVQHVIYHSGQIAMIASMLRSRTRRQSTSGFGGTD